MTKISSASFTSETPFANFLHLDGSLKQQNLNLNLDAPKDWMLTQDDELALNAIPPALEEYFKHIAEDIKANSDAIISHLHAIDWTDPNSVLEGFQPVLDFLQPIFDFVKENPWILLPLVIPALVLFLEILGFAEGGVVASTCNTRFMSGNK